ncbi:MAG: type IX secretion system sortase PorU [Bacteroidia bacterium]|nr:type IX secretion system sortase PorU [Bacteroidia bacterium]
MVSKQAAILAISFYLFLGLSSSIAQEIRYRPVWEGNISRKCADGSLQMSPSFTGCSYREDVCNLPFATLRIPVQAGYLVSITGVTGSATSSPADGVFDKTLNSNDLAGNWFPQNLVELGDIVVERKQTYQLVRVYPLRIQSGGGNIQRYSEMIIHYQTQPSGAAKTQGSRTYAENSVLSTGNWYRLALTKNGIYRLNKGFLANQLGINLADLNPKTIKIYGNGGQRLPQDNAKFRYDDLYENPIYISGEQDGRFDDNDYILFYGEGTTYWLADSSGSTYQHELNIYSDSSYYYLTFGGQDGKRIADKPSIAGDTLVVGDRDLQFSEEDKINPSKSGRLWVGQAFDLNNILNLSFRLNNPTGDVTVRYKYLVRAGLPSIFEIRENGISYKSTNCPTTNKSNPEALYGYWMSESITIPLTALTDGTVDLQFSYQKSTGDIVWLDNVEVEYSRNWLINADQYTIRSKNYQRNVSYEVSGGTSGLWIWNVTDKQNPINQLYQANGQVLAFSSEVFRPSEWIVFRPEGVFVPSFSGFVPNQNLHGLPFAEYLIVVHSDFLVQANRLAELHRQRYNRTVNVVLTQQIWQEFSSGKVDVTAIREFAKMFYDKAGSDTTKFPKYLLLFGDGSYDWKGRVYPGSSFVPSYQGFQSLTPTRSFSSDDYFGFLDDAEGNWGEGTGLFPDDNRGVQTHFLDIGIGRFPVASVAEAEAVVNKIIHYVSDPVTFGDWRNKILLIGDHKLVDGCVHMDQADQLGSLISRNAPCYNLDKVYVDSYRAVNTSGGERFPEAKDALLRKFESGNLFVNYTGHGNEIGISNAYLLELPDIAVMKNYDRLPFMVTATCEFGRYDDPTRRTGAEQLFIHEQGGTIGMMTSVRIVFSGFNFQFNKNFYEYAVRFDSVLNRYLTLGEIYQRSKNLSYSPGSYNADAINTRNFCLFGDPALILNYPKNVAKITQINNKPIDPSNPDTLKAMSKVTITGEVQTPTGTLLENYTGELTAKVFDKPTQFITYQLGCRFQLQKNILFNGVASVKQGKFQFSFIVPLDISYAIGNGRISLYVSDNQEDGSGCTSNVIVCCTDSMAGKPDNPPTVKLMIDSEKWIDGSIVNENPTLIADVSDDLGINTSGLGVGRELTAVLNAADNPIVLNEYYQAKKDSYREGTIRYRFKELPQGEYQLNVKVWDVSNHSGTAETRFIVADDASLALEHIFNYPNPFTTNTTFFFNHNQAGHWLDAQIRIYSISGKLVKSLRQTFYGESSISCSIDWDGLDDFGQRIGRGVYVYEVTVRVKDTGKQISKFEKLVLLR